MQLFNAQPCSIKCASPVSTFGASLWLCSFSVMHACVHAFMRWCHPMRLRILTVQQPQKLWELYITSTSIQYIEYTIHAYCIYHPKRGNALRTDRTEGRCATHQNGQQFCIIHYSVYSLAVYMMSNCSQTIFFEFNKIHTHTHKNRNAWRLKSDIIAYRFHHCRCEHVSFPHSSYENGLLFNYHTQTHTHIHVRKFGFMQHSTISIDWQFWLGYHTNANQTNQTYVHVRHLLLLWYRICETWNLFDPFWWALPVVMELDNTEKFIFSQPKPTSHNQCVYNIIYYLFCQRLCAATKQIEKEILTKHSGKLSYACIIRNHNLAFYHRWHVNSVLKIKQNQTNEGKKEPK